MKGKKSSFRFTTFAEFVLLVPLLLMAPETAFAKSLYLVPNHHTSNFDAWNINPDGTVVYQDTYQLQFATDPAGAAIDNVPQESPTLFLTSEFSYGIELLNPVTLEFYGASIGPRDLAGIDVDDISNIVYTVLRRSNHLYVYHYDEVNHTLTETAQIDLTGTVGAFGLALDETRGRLWVADTAGDRARAYDTNTWTEAESFQVSHMPVDIAIDRVRNIVYTVSIIGGAAIPSGTGSTLLSKYDVDTQIETTVDMGHPGVGIAVDEVTGLVYVTGGAYSGDNLTVWDTSTSPFTKVQDTGWIGNPAGIVIGNVAFNPLNLAKNDTIQGEGIHIGGTFTYEITFDSPTFDVTGAIITDNLPTELDFLSATEDGVYDQTTHTVVWDLGTILANEAIPTIYLDVMVNQNAEPGSIIFNFCTLDGDQIPPTSVIGQDPDDPTEEPGTPILEIQPPVAQCQDVTVPTDAGTCSVASVSVNNGSYDPGGDSITLSQSPTGPYELGDTVVDLTVTNDSGATDSCTAIVTVTDPIPPSVSVLISPDTLWPPNHKMWEVSATVTASDTCDADPTIVLTSVVSNEPDNGAGDGNTENDVQGADIGTDDRSFMLRAERSGKDNGRIYTITYEATDASGNMATGSVTVTVPHNQ